MEAETGVAVAVAGAICWGFVPFGSVPGSVLWPPPIFPEQAANAAKHTDGQKTRAKVITLVAFADQCHSPRLLAAL